MPVENDKPTVLALREIAAGLVDDKMIAAEEALTAEEPLFAAFDGSANESANALAGRLLCK